MSGLLFNHQNGQFSKWSTRVVVHRKYDEYRHSIEWTGRQCIRRDAAKTPFKCTNY